MAYIGRLWGLIRGGKGGTGGAGRKQGGGGGKKITQRGLTEKSKRFFKTFLYMLKIKFSDNFLTFSSIDRIGNLEI